MTFAKRLASQGWFQITSWGRTNRLLSLKVIRYITKTILHWFWCQSMQTILSYFSVSMKWYILKILLFSLNRKCWVSALPAMDKLNKFDSRPSRGSWLLSGGKRSQTNWLMQNLLMFGLLKDISFPQQPPIYHQALIYRLGISGDNNKIWRRKNLPFFGIKWGVESC